LIVAVTPATKSEHYQLNFLVHYYMYVHCLARPSRNKLYCVGWDVKPYTLTETEHGQWL